jgi:hypothetical protein
LHSVQLQSSGSIVVGYTINMPATPFSVIAYTSQLGNPATFVANVQSSAAAVGAGSAFVGTTPGALVLGKYPKNI